jgi:predicted  nucleic acid-binding Zn-ribbon protein
MAATATRKAATPPQPVAPISFDEIARKKMRERLEAYRTFVRQYAESGTLNELEMEKAAELLDLLFLPPYAFMRDVEAVQRHNRTHSKWAAAVENEPANRDRARQLNAEIVEIEKRLRALREEAQMANAAIGKPSAYGQTLSQLAVDHPHVLAEIDTAVKLRIEEMNRRRQMGGAE